MTVPSISRVSLRFAFVVVALAACSTGCASDDKPISTLSQAQRDTVLSRSAIPGASAVGHAFDAAGKEAGHAAAMDSLTR